MMFNISLVMQILTVQQNKSKNYSSSFGRLLQNSVLAHCEICNLPCFVLFWFLFLLFYYYHIMALGCNDL